MTLIDNLNAINDCKEAIKEALVRKNVDMDGVIFSEYAEKIDALQLESGDTPAPTPSADYIYSNGYIDGGEMDIMTYVPYEIKTSDEGGNFKLVEDGLVIELNSPIEIEGWEDVYPDIIFGVDIPEKYDLVYIKVYDVSSKSYILPYGTLNGFKDNIRYKKIVRDGVTYNSYLRYTDGYYESSDLKGDPVVITNPYKYEITIKLK